MSLDSREHWDLTVRRAVSRLFILAALADRPMHGYELGKAVADGSGNCCTPSDAAVYPALKELSEGGFVARETLSQGGRRRSVCTLTQDGHDVLATAAEAWGAVLPHLERVVDEVRADAARRGVDA